MNRTFVALDLETTGLDPERDAILEVGAVRFRTSFDDGTVQTQVLDTWSSLVNPGRHIPIQIQQLTGITEKEVSRAPRFSQVIHEVDRFLGRWPVVGHNVGFDLGFLRSHDLPLSNPAVDTFEIASIMLPHAARYSLSKLGEMLDLPTLGNHRALDDAIAAKDLFTALLEHASELPLSVLQEINRLAGPVDWPLKAIFRDVETRTSPLRVPGGHRPAARRPAFQAGGCSGPPVFHGTGRRGRIGPCGSSKGVDVDKLAAMLEEDGLFAQQFSRLRTPSPAGRDAQRRGHGAQRQAASARRGRHGHGQERRLSSAGSGLCPAQWRTCGRFDQYHQPPGPAFSEGHSRSPGSCLPFEFRAVVLKGRSNYLCQRRLEALRRTGVSSAQEMQMLAKVMVWVPSTQTGERGELFMPNPLEQALWGKVSAESETCTLDRCRFRERGSCFFYRARHAAENAHLIIVNHALLLSDVAVENRVLPEYRYLIVDEAHHLEDNVTRQLSFHADQRVVERMLNELARPVGVKRYSGFLGDVATRCRGVIPPNELGRVGCPRSWTAAQDRDGADQRLCLL